MDAPRISLVVYAGVCFITWSLALLTKEHSWVDRIWSIAPIGYTGIFAGAAGFDDARLDVIFALVSLWGIRLTFNFWRKGGYAPGGEDYRWAVLRARMTPWQFQLFSLFFIVLYQNAILLLISLPAETALDHRRPFGVVDGVFSGLFLALLIGETVADQQQWDFHQRKCAELAASRQPAERFLSTGLFRFSRHPNFFCEQAQWWVVAAFAVVAAHSVPWTVVGAVLLTLLFVGSTRFTEAISLSKYPEYAEYQRRTSAVVPWWPKSGV
jgi:steroid 5-alpha reductase family enzyme